MGGVPGIATAATPGSQLWATRYNGPANLDDDGGALGVSPDGSKVFVTGSSIGSTSADDYATVAYDASTGDQLWAKRYNGPANRRDFAFALAVGPDGSELFVTGASVGSTSEYDYDYATVAYDASTGDQLWATRYSGPGDDYDQPAALGVSPEGSELYVTGRSAGSTGREDYATVAYDSSTGNQLWAKRYNGPGNDHDQATALGVSPDGSELYVTGQSAGSTIRYDYATVAYDSFTGAQLWAKRFDGPANRRDIANALGVSSDGSNVFVTGYSKGGPTSRADYATVAYDTSTGAQAWVKRYDGTANRGDLAFALGVSPDGSEVFVTGASVGSRSGHDYATIAYAASSGDQLWAKRFNGPGQYDFASALGLSPDGSEVFVTGKSTGSTSGSDYATVAYDASTGNQLWAKRLNGPENYTDYATALGVRPGGAMVFVTGSTGSTSGASDYTTVAYSIS
jgi:hypothetical protein